MNWENIRSEYEGSKITLKELAEKHDIKLGTIKSRKSREKWIRRATKRDAAPNKKVATRNLKKDATEETSTEEEVKVFNFLEESDLTDKQRIFCLYYVRSFNATQAAINAGYSPPHLMYKDRDCWAMLEFNVKSNESRNQWSMTFMMCLINMSK